MRKDMFSKGLDAAADQIMTSERYVPSYVEVRLPLLPEDVRLLERAVLARDVVTVATTDTVEELSEEPEKLAKKMRKNLAKALRRSAPK